MKVKVEELVVDILQDYSSRYSNQMLDYERNEDERDDVHQVYDVVVLSWRKIYAIEKGIVLSH